MPRKLIIASLGVLLAGTMTFSAQQSATVTLRSGSTVSGQLVDLGAGGLTFRVDGADRQIPLSDVHAIDFGGSAIAVPDEARTLPSGTHLLVLRSGDLVAGEFFDVGGTSPLRVTFRTSSGDRDYSGADVRQIYVTRAADAPAVAGQRLPAAAATRRTVQVSSRSAWTPTGITVRQGQTIWFDATGEIRIDAQNAMAASAGNDRNMYDARAPIPDALQGALIGRIGAVGRGGAGRAFAIGNQSSVVMPGTGLLFLGINDSRLNDNDGAFTVVVGY